VSAWRSAGYPCDYPAIAEILPGLAARTGDHATLRVDLNPYRMRYEMILTGGDSVPFNELAGAKQFVEAGLIPVQVPR
jgi:hypothetical protein